MNKHLTAIAFCSAAMLSVFAATNGTASHEETNASILMETKGMTRTRMNAAGRLPRKESMKGKIAFIDTQSTMSESEIRKVISSLSEDRVFNFVYEKAKPSADYLSLKASSAATIAIVIVDDPVLAPSLVSPDQGWGMVNIANTDLGLRSDAAKGKFLDSRRRKQLMRIYSMVAGGWKSNYPGNIASVNTISDLDLVSEQLPVDVVDRNMKHFKANGVSPMIFVPYGVACREGWAPAPTNDIQKTIWDKVHAIPKTPMKIEFDPKKGR